MYAYAGIVQCFHLLYAHALPLDRRSPVSPYIIAGALGAAVILARSRDRDGAEVVAAVVLLPILDGEEAVAAVAAEAGAHHEIHIRRPTLSR